MIYKWRQVSNKVSAQEVGEELAKIQEENKVIAPQQVVETARNEHNILHSLFEWDDSKAGNIYRIWQARFLLRNIETVVIDQEENEHKTFAFVNIQTTEIHGYQSVDVVVQNDTSREYMLSQAKKEMLSFKRKYQELKELASLFAEIDKMLGIAA